MLQNRPDKLPYISILLIENSACTLLGYKKNALTDPEKREKRIVAKKWQNGGGVIGEQLFHN